ncbi:MAG: response regulator [Desulfobacter sp.]|nr:MAG: response regulator [Desulfobacter sp.]
MIGKMIRSLDRAYKEAVAANDKLSGNQRQLKDTNRILRAEIENHRVTENRLQRSYDTQTVANRILQEAMTDSSIQEILDHSLDLLLSIPWLAFESQGSIHLVGDEPGILVLKAQRGFPEALEKQCRSIPFGKCLCGRAALERKIVYAAHIDRRHEISFPGIQDHGHYCIPLVAKAETLGILNIYLKPGHERSEWEEDFLMAAANTLAVVIVQRRGEVQKKEIEQRLLQSQKMESIGTLAGGIAHDFNNILSGIFGYTQLAERCLDDPEKAKDRLAQIYRGASRASDLIQQILTFSRKAEYKKVPVKLREVVEEVTGFLRSSLPASIDIIQEITSKSYVMAEPTKIHQIVMNLCTNASHAMRENGGQLHLTLTDVGLDSQAVTQFPDMPKGDYVRLEVRDNGVGMEKEVLDKIFEPYFTTKKIKEGTGLGLSVVLGIVQEHKGYIQADSTPGKGTAFQLFFPKVSTGNSGEKGAVRKDFDIPGGAEHILIVDDEKSILDSTSELLRDYGYHVSEFSTPGQALSQFLDTPGGFDLVITDMTMPVMSGEELALKILEASPHMPVLLCTGYSDKISKNKALRMGIRKFVQKPVVGEELLAMIRKILDEGI